LGEVSSDWKSVKSHPINNLDRVNYSPLQASEAWQQKPANPCASQDQIRNKFQRENSASRYNLNLWVNKNQKLKILFSYGAFLFFCDNNCKQEQH
jgi:hypothetical protein